MKRKGKNCRGKTAGNKKQERDRKGNLVEIMLLIGILLIVLIYWAIPAREFLAWEEEDKLYIYINQEDLPRVDPVTDKSWYIVPAHSDDKRRMEDILEDYDIYHTWKGLFRVQDYEYTKAWYLMIHTEDRNQYMYLFPDGRVRINGDTKWYTLRRDKKEKALEIRTKLENLFREFQ